MLHDSIHAQVKAQYEAYPYPAYPLLAKPRWQDGYGSFSGFIARLIQDLTGSSSQATEGKKILLAGCGDMQPYILRKFEPPENHLTCLDLSKSSLRRARFRLALGLKTGGIDFVQADLDTYLTQVKAGTFQHCEAYGVLHHLADPARTCKVLAKSLSAGATLRVMVYNSPARTWIHSLQKVFRLLHLSPFVREDVAKARQFIAHCQVYLPRLAHRLQQTGPSLLHNDSRFVDTFFHAREVRLSPTRWLQILREAGLVPVALFDRYAELDDLPNPLWQLPSEQELAERCADGRFENNLELLCVKEGRSRQGACTKQALPWQLRLKGPPLSWFHFAETTGLSAWTRLQLWNDLQSYVATGTCAGKGEQAFTQVPLAALQRLARLGAILPGGIASQELRVQLLMPMTDMMETPVLPEGSCTSREEVLQAITKLLREKGIHSTKRSETIFRRLTSQPRLHQAHQRSQGEPRHLASPKRHPVLP